MCFQIAVDLLQYTIAQYKQVSSQEVQMSVITEEERREFIYKTTVTFEDFVLQYGRYHLSEAKPQINKTYSKLGKSSKKYRIKLID